MIAYYPACLTAGSEAVNEEQVRQIVGFIHGDKRQIQIAT